MENTNASGGDFKFTFLLVLAMVAMGVSSGLRVQPASPPAPEGAELPRAPLRRPEPARAPLAGSD